MKIPDLIFECKSFGLTHSKLKREQIIEKLDLFEKNKNIEFTLD